MNDASSLGMAWHMHRATLALLVVSCIGGVLLGCATPSAVPKGSRKIGVYTGAFDDDPWTVTGFPCGKRLRAPKLSPVNS